MAVQLNESLDWAREHIFALGINDSGTELCITNMCYGLAKIHHLQSQLGLKPDATFIGSPDMTITRNTYRWQSGFGYGGLLSWGSGEEDLVILDSKPNACGMLVGGLERLMPAPRILEKMEKFKDSIEILGDTEVKLDFGRGNHFINLFSVKRSKLELPPYIFVLHGAGGEFRQDNPKGFGLYWDQSPRLMELADTITTPWGELRVLTGPQAEDYYNFYCFAEEFSRQRRLLVAERLFDAFQVISNENHQGLISKNAILLGSHSFESENDTLYPVMLRADLPGYLLHGKKNLKIEQLEKLGFHHRAMSLGVNERLINANLLPHGGGYYFPDLEGVKNIHNLNSSRFFELELKDSPGTKILSGVREIPYTYRGQEVIEKTVELELGEVAAILQPIYSFKV